MTSTGVAGAALIIIEVVNDGSDRQAEELVQTAHPLGVAAGKVVVDRDHVDAFAGQRIQVRGQRGDQRFTFTSLHFGDLAAMKSDATDQLDVVVPHPEDALTSFANNGESLGKNVIEGFAIGEALAELDGLRGQLFIRKRLQLWFPPVDGSHESDGELSSRVRVWCRKSLQVQRRACN